MTTTAPADPARLTTERLKAQLLLLIAESPAHGYALVGHLRSANPGAVQVVAVYRALWALERDGVVVSAWDQPAAGPARRTYRPSAAGAARLCSFAGRLSAAGEGVAR